MPKDQSRAATKSRDSPYPAPVRTTSTVHRNMQRDSPHVSSGAWSPQSDEILLRARAERLSWGPLAKRYFPEKSGNACRKRYERLMERKRVESIDGDRIEELARAYFEVHEQMWRILADRVHQKWHVVEAKVSCTPVFLAGLEKGGRDHLDTDRLRLP